MVNRPNELYGWLALLSEHDGQGRPVDGRLAVFLHASARLSGILSDRNGAHPPALVRAARELLPTGSSTIASRIFFSLGQIFFWSSEGLSLSWALLWAILGGPPHPLCKPSCFGLPWPPPRFGF